MLVLELNTRLISTNLQYQREIATGAALAVVVAVFFFGFVSAANAGFKDLFLNKKLTRDIQTVNSQTVLLLGTNNSSNKNFTGLGGGDIAIEGDSLISISGPLSDEKESGEKGQISIYVVREGDTLTDIARLFNVSVNTIFWANDLTSKDKIQPGQTLVILPISGIQYKIKKGDTIEKIAKKFRAEPDDIISFNGLSAQSGLTTGETIIVPDGEFSEPSVQSPGAFPSSGYADYGGYYSRPISGGRKSQGIHGFNGVDLATYCDEPVYASASGDVIISRFSGWNGGYGKYAAISHSNGTQTLYAHLNSIIVSSGWHIVKGQTIGYVGSTGKSTGCHLHFEVRGAKNPF